MRVRKAVFPAAGWGTRFLPATKAQPKEMLPLVDKPVIQYAVEEAVAAGIEQVIIVTSSQKRAIEDHFDTSYELERLLEEKGDIRVLAHPTLMAKSGEKASFLAGGEFPIPVASAQGANAVTVTIEWKEFGVKLDFTPIIGDDGKITLKVAQEVSQIDFTNPLALNGFTVPTVITRKTSTTVELGSGEHLVIGGLKQTDKLKTVRRIPILGQIPIAGIFFSSTRTESVDRELLVVVSPELVQSASSTLPALPTDRPQR